MNMQNFEEQLSKMSKPEISSLKHQDMLAESIFKARDKFVLSWWWLCIPLYLVAAFIMKSCFMPAKSFLSSLHDFAEQNIYSALLLFVLIPVVFIVMNAWSIRKIYFLSGSPKTTRFLLSVWMQMLIILFAIFILIIYILQLSYS